MITLIVFIIFTLSIGGIVFIGWKKMPELAELPSKGGVGIKKPNFVYKLEEKLGEISVNFQKHVLLHKFLFWVKCIVSKTEHRIDNWLHNIRKKAQQKNKKN